MSAALTFIVPPNFDKRAYLRGLEEGAERHLPSFEKAMPGDPRIRVVMPCCGAKLRFRWDTFPLGPLACECGSGMLIAEWEEEKI